MAEDLRLLRLTQSLSKGHPASIFEGPEKPTGLAPSGHLRRPQTRNPWVSWFPLWWEELSIPYGGSKQERLQTFWKGWQGFPQWPWCKGKKTGFSPKVPGFWLPHKAGSYQSLSRSELFHVSSASNQRPTPPATNHFLDPKKNETKNLPVVFRMPKTNKHYRQNVAKPRVVRVSTGRCLLW